MSGERVLSIGPASPEAIAALPAGTKIVDADGKWVIPGLIDAHVHAESEQDFKTMLAWGITSVRLMAEDVASARALAAASRERRDIPEVFPAAPIFTAKGGWWDQTEPPDRNVDRFPATPGRARSAVREARALGADEIKVMWDDMGWCRDPKPRLAKIEAEVARALFDEARRQGMRASVHAPNLPDARAAIDAGATALAHGILERLDGATIERMKNKSVFYVPTMDVFEFLADARRFVDSVLADPRAVEGLPAETVARYRSAAYSDGYRARYPNFENVRRLLPALGENLRRLHAAGVPVALGTDMWAFPGLGVSIEMDLWVKQGISALEALRAATQTAARSLGIDRDRGTLQPGKRADFLVLSADPVADVKNVRAIAAVYKNGRAVYRERRRGS